MPSNAPPSIRRTIKPARNPKATALVARVSSLSTLPDDRPSWGVIVALRRNARVVAFQVGDREIPIYIAPGDAFPSPKRMYLRIKMLL